MSALRLFRERAGLSRAELAHLARTSEAQIFRLEQSPDAKNYRKMTKEWAVRLAPFVAATPEQLLFAAEPTPPELKVRAFRPEVPLKTAEPRVPRSAPISTRPSAPEPDANIVVYDGAPAAGQLFSYALDHIAGHETRPPGLIGRQGVYAVRITDSSMAPALTRGALAYVDAGSPVRLGDDVVIEMHRDPREIGARRYFRRIIGQDEAQYICRRFNPQDDEIFPIDDVKVIHRIIPAREANGH